MAKAYFSFGIRHEDRFFEMSFKSRNDGKDPASYKRQEKERQDENVLIEKFPRIHLASPAGVEPACVQLAFSDLEDRRHTET